MKSVRHNTILELIQNENIDTQEELVKRLCELGFDVTQATVSRDIKDLRLIKTLTPSGRYQYSVGEKNENAIFKRVISMFSKSVLSIVSAGDLVVIKVISGSANVAGEAIDTLNLPEIAGCIAGDNTLFIAVHDKYKSKDLVSKLKTFLK